MLFLLACLVPSTTSRVNEPEVSFAVETGNATDSATSSDGVLTELATSLNAAKIEEGVIISSTQAFVGASYYLSVEGETIDVKNREPDGATPDEVELSPDTWCADFNATSVIGTRYVSAVVCEDVTEIPVLTTPLCVDLAGDWICEDMWGEGTPDVYYTNRDVKMENGCEVELIGITWGSQRAHVDGHLLTFELGEYAATGIISEDGWTITFVVDVEVDYWSTCQKRF